MKPALDKSTARFLIQASLLFRDTCPELSRHLMRAPAQANDSVKMLPDTAVCSFCFQWLQPNNQRVRVRPKERPSARVHRALRRQAQSKRLSRVHKTLLQRYYKSSSVLMATCHSCSRTSRHKGVSREFIALSRSHSTPGNTGKHKTPPSASRSSSNTPKSAGKDKTPVHTPRASISTNSLSSGSTSSQTPGTKGKNWVVQRLSKILMREEGEGRKKGGLKDFLSSL